MLKTVQFFVRMPLSIMKDSLKCMAKTTLKGKLVTSVWELKQDFSVRFITLIPRDDKKWK